MLIDTMFARDMYQVYEINDDWFLGGQTKYGAKRQKKIQMF